MKKGIPKRWEKYVPVGRHVPGTRFLPFKVPLKMELCQKRPEADWFTPCLLLESRPMVKAIIDLTDTQRYYDSEEFTSRGVLYKKVNITGGGKLPPASKLRQFYDVVDYFLRAFGRDSDALIGVHCTHGLNRTGYLICKYMVARLKIDPQEAIKTFEEARGYKIEREVYTDDIKGTTTLPQTEPDKHTENWRHPSTSSTPSTYKHTRSPPPTRYPRERENWRAEPPTFHNNYNSRHHNQYFNRYKYKNAENYSNNCYNYRKRGNDGC